MNSQKQHLKQKEACRNGTASNDNLPPQIETGKGVAVGVDRLSGLATLVWLAGIGWVAVKLLRWLAE